MGSFIITIVRSFRDRAGVEGIVCTGRNSVSSVYSVYSIQVSIRCSSYDRVVESIRDQV